MKISGVAGAWIFAVGINFLSGLFATAADHPGRLFADDYDSYSIGDLEGAPYGNADIAIINSQHVSGTNSLKLFANAGETSVFSSGLWSTNTETTLYFFLASSFASTDAEDGLSVSPFYVNNSSKYELLVRRNASPQLELRKYAGSSVAETLDSKTLPANYSVGTWYALKIRINADVMSAKIWEKDDSEPGEWDVEGAVAGLSGPGRLKVGWKTHEPYSRVVCLDDVSVVSDPGEQSQDEAFFDDYEGCSAGIFNLPDTYSNPDISVINTKQVSSPNSLRLIANNSRTEVFSSDSWSNRVDLSCSFYVASQYAETNSSDGLYLSPFFISHSSKYELLIRRNTSPLIELRVFTNNVVPLVVDTGSLSGGLEVGAWYNIKVRVDDGIMCAKVWRQGDVEPAGWAVSGTVPEINGAGHLYMGWQAGEAYSRAACVDDVFIRNFEPVHLYVSESGDDGNTGSETAPFRTISKARDAVRLLNGDLLNDIFVNLRGGTYVLDETLALSEEDSGGNGHDVVYRSYPGERASISGARQITNWVPDVSSAIANLWKADLSGTNNFRQMYVDGAKAERSKGSYTPFLLAVKTNVFTRYVDGTNTVSIDVYDGYTPKYDDSIYSWRNIEDIEFSYSYWFVNHKIPIDSIATNGATRYLKMKQPGFRDAQIKMLRNLPEGYFYVENAYEVMDEPGEWYFDRGSNVCYYIAENGDTLTSSNNITFPAVETLVTLSGTTNQAVQNIQFQNIDFECTTWLQPSIGGYAEAQGGLMKDPDEDEILHSSYLKPAAAVKMEYAHNVMFAGNSFRQMGAVAISMDSGCQSNVVEGNTFEECASSALQIGGFTKEDAHPNVPANPDWGRLVVKDNLIANNYMHRIGTEFFGAAAVLVGFTDGTKVLHNHISDISWVGVSAGGGLGYWDDGGRPPVPINYPVYTEPTISQNNQISFNHIYNAFQNLGDGGAIYTQSSMTNSAIVGNYIHDNVHRYGGIYFDTGSAGILVESNVVHHVVTPFLSNWRSISGQQKDAGPLTNYFNINPSDEDFPGAVADVAGLEGAYSSLYTSPEIITIDQERYGAYQDVIEIRGVNFGSQTGSVVFAGDGGGVTLSAASEKINLWSDSRIQCLIPEGAVSGDVFIRNSAEVPSNCGMLSYSVGDFEVDDDAVADDFDTYASGEFSASGYVLTDDGAGAFYIINTKSVSSPNSLKIISNSGAAQVSRLGASSDGVLLMCNLRLYTALSGENVLRICPIYYDECNFYGLFISPNGGNNLVVKKCVNQDIPEILAETNKSIDSTLWYSVKILLLDGAFYAKLWPYDSAEPLAWDIYTGDMSGLYTDKGMSRISFNLDTAGDSGDHIVLIDDLYAGDWAGEIADEIREVIDDDYSSCSTGVLCAEDYLVTTDTNNCLIVDDQSVFGKILEVRANDSSGNTKVYHSAEWNEASLQMSFRVNDMFESTEGCYISPYYVDANNMYQLYVQPAGRDSPVRLTKAVEGTVTTDLSWYENIQTGQWYNIKMLVSEIDGAKYHPLKIKIWPCSEIEPAGWDAVCEGGQMVNGCGQLRLAVSAGSSSNYKSVSFDNLHVMNWDSMSTVPNSQDEMYLISSLTGENGAVIPLGDVWVVQGDDIEFKFVPEAYYHVSDVLVDGVSFGALTNFTWTNAAASGTVRAVFAADLAAGGTPYWWLAEHDLITTSISFDVAERMNPDGDGYSNLEEYVLDTDPTDSNSYFRFEYVSGSYPPQVQFFSLSSRTYTLQCTVDLMDGQWGDVKGCGPRLGVGGWDLMIDTNRNDQQLYYRVQVDCLK